MGDTVGFVQPLAEMAMNVQQVVWQPKAASCHLVSQPPGIHAWRQENVYYPKNYMTESSHMAFKFGWGTSHDLTRHILKCDVSSQLGGMSQAS